MAQRKLFITGYFGVYLAVYTHKTVKNIHKTLDYATSITKMR